MKQGMTNVDVAAIAAELAPIVVGARVDRAYQPAKEQILLRLRRKGAGKTDLLFEMGRFLTATKRPPANPDRPSMVAQILRDRLENGRVVGFRQLGFDRLLQMDIDRGDGRRSLVFELFGDGNLLLLDGQGTIELPVKGGDFGARRLRKGEAYQTPPGATVPWGLDEAALKAKATRKDVVRFLAVDLGFGPLWAEELCLRAGLPKATSIDALDAPTGDAASGWALVRQAIAGLGAELARNDLAPALVYDTEVAPNEPSSASPASTGAPRPVDAVPFTLRAYPSPRYAHEEAATFREALDLFFVGGPESDDEEEPEDPRRPRFEEARAKVLRQVAQTDEAIARLAGEEAEAQRDGEALYASFPAVQALLSSLNAARRERSWADIEAALAKGRDEGNAAAQQVPVLRPHEGTARFVVADADGVRREVDVDLRLSVQENAEARFAEAKRARSRREGAEVARRDALARLAAVDAAGLDAFGPAPARAERTSRHFWFESYRWTITPHGFVAVGGRSAAQNDAVVKKYLRDGDRYAHAETHGAPSVVIRKAEGPPAEVPPEDLRAACHFAAAASRAWRQGGAATAYWVTASQVSKTPRSGEFVPRGAWIIHGKRNAEPDLPMQWCVGLVDFRLDGSPVLLGQAVEGRTVQKLVGGARESLRPYCSKVLLMVPGPVEPSDAAQALVERFAVSNEEAAAVLPAGPVEFQGEVAP